MLSLLRIRQFWWKKFIKLIKEIKEFEKILLVLLFNLRPPIPSFHIVNMLFCRGHFSNTAFIDAKTQHRSPCILDVCLQTHHVYSTLKRRGNGRFQVVLTWKTLCEFGGFLALLTTSLELLRRTPLERLWGTSSGRR